eukprot:TRINITY_DN12989_c0_g1::TRINITY_DN12989_c0_g1_i1::g.11133::m.11133 TRINITY_DN12989_c0_g1::TRINITY_DN12989_c0_g1_i1::g.11133  ORF type:complete len:344 (-),score=11.87,sp/Q8BYK8/ZC3H6_MOUSE/29.79/2e-17,zf-CCCH/PF00642.19/0.023,zf-CCCH/PF00642.19/0.09,zf-CCCH/PF00642.19/0.0097 TRINITY_DN12989_c0_g1_i1:30-1061(-)
MNVMESPEVPEGVSIRRSTRMGKKTGAGGTENVRGSKSKTKAKTKQADQHQVRAAKRSKPRSPPRCTFYAEGRCTREQCTYSHSFEVEKKKEVCKFFRMGACTKGDCVYSHDLKNDPCRFFHLKNRCNDGERCPYGHSPITPAELEKVREAEREYFRDRGTAVEQDPLARLMSVPADPSKLIPITPPLSTSLSLSDPAHHNTMSHPHDGSESHAHTDPHQALSASPTPVFSTSLGEEPQMHYTPFVYTPMSMVSEPDTISPPTHTHTPSDVPHGVIRQSISAEPSIYSSSHVAAVPRVPHDSSTEEPRPTPHGPSIISSSIPAVTTTQNARRPIRFSRTIPTS